LLDWLREDPARLPWHPDIRRAHLWQRRQAVLKGRRPYDSGENLVPANNLWYLQ
jgi:hypothetical protein